MVELDPWTISQLADVRSYDEALKVWHEHRTELEGYLFVLSQPGQAAINWPSKIDLPGNGFLRSVFAHDRLWFTSHEVIDAMFGPDGKADLRLDYSIGFDSNAAQYLRDLVEGRLDSAVLRFRDSLQLLAERRFNWELAPALSERSEEVFSGRNLDQVWRIAYASEYFDACDLGFFAETGQLKLTRGEDEVRDACQRVLSEWHRMLVSGEMKRLRDFHALYHVLLLKIAILYRARPSPRDACRNLCEFVEFMCGVAGINLPWMLWAASSFFEQGGTFELLRKLTRPPDRLADACRNTAWDIMHFVDRRMFAQLGGRDGAFLVPYTLTFDRGLAQLLEHQAQRSCLVHPEWGMPQFFAEAEIFAELRTRYNDDQALLEVAGRHFTAEAHVRRAAQVEKAIRNRDSLVAELEASIARSGS